MKLTIPEVLGKFPTQSENVYGKIITPIAD